MHLQTGDAHHESRSVKCVFAVVITKNVAHVLAQEALDALAELLHAVDIFLVISPVGIWLWCELGNFLFTS